MLVRNPNGRSANLNLKICVNKTRRASPDYGIHVKRIFVHKLSQLNIWRVLSFSSIKKDWDLCAGESEMNEPFPHRITVLSEPDCDFRLQKHNKRSIEVCPTHRISMTTFF